MQSVPSSGDTLSPDEKKFNRRFRTQLPALEPIFNPVVHVAGRKQFLVGDRVCFQNAVSKCWYDKGMISKIRDSGRSYYVNRDIGLDTVLHNNIFLKRFAASFVHEAAEKNQMSSALCLCLFLNLMVLFMYTYYINNEIDSSE
jgi:hypothetical protein